MQDLSQFILIFNVNNINGFFFFNIFKKMAVFTFALFACMLAFIDANDVAENKIAGM